jgi:hypothetical protein
MQEIFSANSFPVSLKLTIAIPTRNRYGSFKKVVDEVCWRILEAGAISEIQLIIVDDYTSGIETENHVKYLMKEYGFVSYYRCEDGLGLDKTVLRCLELAVTKYVWIINDHSSMPEGVLSRILKYLQDEFIYIFAPDSGNLKHAFRTYAISKTGLGFINTLINTSIFNKEMLLPYFKYHLAEYDGSWLVFQVANLDMIFDNQNLDILLLPFECSLYGKYMDAERQKTSWNSNWDSYVTIGYQGAKILAYIKNKHNLSDSFYKEIFNNREWGLAACNAYMRLRKTGKRKAEEIANVISGHPTYNYIERKIITKAITTGDKALLFYEVILLVYGIFYGKFYDHSIKQVIRQKLSHIYRNIILRIF